MPSQSSRRLLCGRNFISSACCAAAFRGVGRLFATTAVLTATPIAGTRFKSLRRFRRLRGRLLTWDVSIQTKLQQLGWRTGVTPSTISTSSTGVAASSPSIGLATSTLWGAWIEAHWARDSIAALTSIDAQGEGRVGVSDTKSGTLAED